MEIVEKTEILNSSHFIMFNEKQRNELQICIVYIKQILYFIFTLAFLLVYIYFNKPRGNKIKHLNKNGLTHQSELILCHFDKTPIQTNVNILLLFL